MLTRRLNQQKTGKKTMDCISSSQNVPVAHYSKDIGQKTYFEPWRG